MEVASKQATAESRGSGGTVVLVVAGMAAVVVLIVGLALWSMSSSGPSPRGSSGSGLSGTPLSLRSATVTDLSVPFAASESEAITSHGFLGQGSLGRIGMGCQVSVLKTTDRAAQVTLTRCPDSDNNTSPSSLKSEMLGKVPGWVAKSALDLKP